MHKPTLSTERAKGTLHRKILLAAQSLPKCRMLGSLTLSCLTKDFMQWSSALLYEVHEEVHCKQALAEPEQMTCQTGERVELYTMIRNDHLWLTSLGCCFGFNWSLSRHQRSWFQLPSDAEKGLRAARTATHCISM